VINGPRHGVKSVMKEDVARPSRGPRRKTAAPRHGAFAPKTPPARSGQDERLRNHAKRIKKPETRDADDTRGRLTEICCGTNTKPVLKKHGVKWLSCLPSHAVSTP